MQAQAYIILAQSDTTAGLFSTEFSQLNHAKRSPPHKPLLQVVEHLSDLKARVPVIHRAFVRRTRASCIYPNGKAFRVIRDPSVLDFLEHFGALYSTSANLSGGDFDLKWAQEVAHILIEDKRGLYKAPPSAIFKLSRTHKRRFR
ncbi:N6-threonylcarbamoyl adenosine t(6)A37 modification in tRNA [Helicobacter sp. L8]|uniref:N6-threonylcarbamoyl adenosine t(6)A37 modification in tRNA n=1 Tax=Helicobacter sp. L8 TaxID=2316078 RepID=UPI0019696449|nr:N6-threonylcarbamoyl adenosine t(6)A37 modification in tRNA [Helicobacter sp. L8]